MEQDDGKHEESQSSVGEPLCGYGSTEWSFLELKAHTPKQDARHVVTVTGLNLRKQLPQSVVSRGPLKCIQGKCEILERF